MEILPTRSCENCKADRTCHLSRDVRAASDRHNWSQETLRRQYQLHAEDCPAYDRQTYIEWFPQGDYQKALAELIDRRDKGEINIVSTMRDGKPFFIIWEAGSDYPSGVRSDFS